MELDAGPLLLVEPVFGTGIDAVRSGLWGLPLFGLFAGWGCFWGCAVFFGCSASLSCWAGVEGDGARGEVCVTLVRDVTGVRVP